MNTGHSRLSKTGGRIMSSAQSNRRTVRPRTGVQ